MYKKNKEMQGNKILIKDLDSLGWNSNYIIVFSKGSYNIISKKDQSVNILQNQNREDIFKNEKFKEISMRDINDL